MNNKSVFRPKGFVGAVYMLLCVLSAVGLIAYLLTTPEAPASPALIAAAGLSSLHALGTVIAVLCRKKSGTWLMSIAQSLLLVLSLLSLIICAVMFTALSSSGEAGLLDTVNKLHEAVGVSPISAAALAGAGIDSTALLIAAGLSAFSMIYSTTALITLSSLKSFYRGKNRTSGTVLFGLLSLVSAVIAFLGYAMYLLGCEDISRLPDAVASADLGALPVWSFLWAAASVLAQIAVAFCAFRVRKVIRRRKAAVLEETFAVPAPAASIPVSDDAPEEHDYFDGFDDLTDTNGTKETPAEAASEAFFSEPETQWTAPAESESATNEDDPFSVPEDAFIPDEEEYFPSVDENKAAEPAPAFDDETASIDEEFSGCTLPATPTAKRRTRRPRIAAKPRVDENITDYGYSEDTII